MTYSQLKAIARKSVYMEHEKDTLPVVLATMLANRLDTHPVWLMIIAGPSSGKTIFINALQLCQEGIMVSMLTPKTLISGAKNRDTVDGKEASLMAKIDGKVMLIKDASTITEMNKNTRAEVFSQLRTAFDGTLEKDSGLGRKVFKAKFGIILAGTSTLEKVRTFESSLGERFINFRPCPEDYDKVNALSNLNREIEGQLAIELAEAVAEYLDSAGVPKNLPVPHQIAQHAQLLVSLRAGVSRDPYGKWIDQPADDGIESPYRVSKQLGAMYSSLCHVTNNKHTALAITKRLALDSVPYVRMRLMQCLQAGLVRQADIIRSMKMSETAVVMLVGGMEALGILETKATSNSKKVRLIPKYKKLFNLCTRI